MYQRLPTFWILAVCCGLGALVLCGCGAKMATSTEVRIGAATPELTTQWWQWAMATPSESNPVRDLTGIHCGVGQSGDVWFLAGGFGPSKIRRSCEVPRSKQIFFPLINMANWPMSEQ